MIKAALFAIILWGVQGYDGPGLVPLPIGYHLHLIATHHGLDPVDAAAILLAEHHGRDWAPDLKGRHGPRPREVGLFQLVPEWGVEARERCSHQGKRYSWHHPHTRLKAWLPDCLHILSGERVHLDTIKQNLEAGVIAFGYLQARRREWRTWYTFRPALWQAMFRCQGRAWRVPPLESSPHRWQRLGLSRPCYWSVGRVLKWRADIMRAWEG